MYMMLVACFSDVIFRYSSRCKLMDIRCFDPSQEVLDDNSAMAPKVYLITGCSTGFGKSLVEEVLERGDIAIATARNTSKLDFSGTSDKNYLALQLDVTSKDSVKKCFADAKAKFGRLDAVVNNAGYGLSGEFESLTDDQIKQQMDVNFFGLLDCTREAMQIMREQKPVGGRILQVTSVGGQIGVPTFSIYCASKWAVEGFTEATQSEIDPAFNIKFTCIEPGPFRTDWSGRSMTHSDPHPAYGNSPAAERRKATKQNNGKQPGDPRRAAKAMCEVVESSEPPLRIQLGNPATDLLKKKVDSYKENIDKWEKLSRSCDFEDGK